MEQLQSHIWLTASSSMGKYLRISSYIRKLFLIHDFATAPLWISLYMRKIWIYFLSVYLYLLFFLLIILCLHPNLSHPQDSLLQPVPWVSGPAGGHAPGGRGTRLASRLLPAPGQPGRPARSRFLGLQGAEEQLHPRAARRRGRPRGIGHQVFAL